MADENIHNYDDLKGFEDYLAEFDSIMAFDNEDCPICGVNIPEKTTSDNSPFIDYIHAKKESDLISIKKKLDLLGIPMRIEKRLDSNVLDIISYDYVVLIPLRCLVYLKKEKV